MKNTDLAQLLRELAEHAESPTELAPFEISGLADCARQAAEEVEGRGKPTVDEIGYLIAASASNRSAARAILARFGVWEEAK